ncbi:ABC transporter substrate-binding protein [Paraburkholderia fungorum]|uniref:Nitrate ABC transporter substrate-binding protein n=1 Tax=Paraburkholderia fungorum TaxID=134537 RepID=A0A3R7IKK0_9BURK|nr:ABC transporter substrate-binding protein [Paraburkholderia fungorum]RKF40037.1 nitrate ABC transporter substrate-binding protein [Paraburkholderia fungorum]
MSTTVAQAATPTALWYTRCPVPTALGIAVHRGWFDEEFGPDGITLSSLQETREPAKRESHFDHSLPSSFRQGGNIPALWARSRGAATRVVGLSWTNEFQAIVTLPTSGIRHPRDLRGRRLGLPKHAISIDFWRAAALKGFLTALELDGLGHGDAQWVDLPEPTRGAGEERIAIGQPGLAVGNVVSFHRPHEYGLEVAALVRGDVDAIFVKGVAGLETVHLIDGRVVIDLGAHPDPLVRIGNGTPRTLTVDQALIDERPDLVSRFVSVVVGAGDWATKHPAETVAYIGRETRSSDEWVRYAYGGEVHRHLETNLAQTSIDGLVAFKDFLFEWGFLEHDFDARAWIEPRPYTEVSKYRRAWVA